MKRLQMVVACAVLLALLALGTAPLSADPVVNTFKVSIKVPTLTVGKKYAFTFKLYGTLLDADPFFVETKPYTVPASKTITHLLGSMNLAEPIHAGDFLQQLWVEASVPNKAPFPRVALGPVPLAIGSQNADMVDGLHAAEFAAFDHDHGIPPSAGDADTLDGQHGAFYRDAANLDAGTLGDGRLSANVALLGGSQTVTGTKTFNPPGGAAPFAVNAANTTAVANLNADLLDGLHGAAYRDAANLDAGTLGTDRYSAYGDLGAEGYLDNAAGDLALNNGTLQATLYAQRAASADGLDASALAALDLRYRSAPLLPSLGGYTVATVDPSPASGADSSIGVTIGADGLPVIVYADLNASAVKVFHCNDAPCSSGTVNTVYAMGAGDFGIDAAITIGSNGFPVLAFFNDFDLDLYVAVCGDPACASSSITVPDFTGAVGMDPSITVGTDGFPVISYWDLTNTNLKVFHCTNASCTTGGLTAPDTGGSVGSASSIAIGAGGFPVVSYWDGTNGDLKLLLCGNAACTLGNSVITADSAGNVGSFTSVAIGADGFPVVSYHDVGNLDLKVFHCGNATCTTGNSATTVDGAGDVGLFSSITIGAGGLPVVSYQDGAGFNLKVLNCGNAACTSGNVIRTLDSTGSVGWNTSATSGADGLPVIAYWDLTNAAVKMARGFMRPLGRR